MDTAWIQVFVLTLSECVAPAGKTICQEQALELQFLTRSGCHLCDDALSVLDAAARRARVSVEVLDIDQVDALLAEYDFRVPVIRDAAGTVLAEGLIEPAAIERIVTEARTP